MKTLFALMVLLSSGCKRAEAPAILPAVNMTNISYGTDSAQKLDLYLPEGRGPQTKTIILVHGGGWSGGSRRDLDYLIPQLRKQFPAAAIANMDYRLATSQSPAYPKQVDDLSLAVKHLSEADYGISEEFAFIGTSAGAHLAMLYSYRNDVARRVHVVASIVGPADFTDPAYTSNPYFHFGLSPLVGPASGNLHPEALTQVSPAAHVSRQSPPTILFYGGRDPLVPASQGRRLKQRLDDAGVASELHIYPRAAHGNWDAETSRDMTVKLSGFFGRYL